MPNEGLPDYKVADCCLNCGFRDGRIGTKVLCTKHRRKSDNNVGWMPERGWCCDYKRTENEAILRGERMLMNIMKDELEGK